MKWEQDLIKDIRTHTDKDDVDYPLDFSPELAGKLRRTLPEFNACNHRALRKALSVGGVERKTFLEIGVCRNGGESSTHTILNHLKDGGVYLGVDLEDKSFLNDNQKGIHTLRTNSSNLSKVCETMGHIGIKELDFIHIDGWHSINQVLDDWEYTQWLSKDGVVGFHDTTAHPGPYLFVRALNPEIWNVEIDCLNDHGFTFCYKK